MCMWLESVWLGFDGIQPTKKNINNPNKYFTLAQFKPNTNQVQIIVNQVQTSSGYIYKVHKEYIKNLYKYKKNV